MKIILPLLLSASAFIAICAHGASPYRPRMTGEQLVRDMTADPSVGFNAAKRERAMGYIAGVMDAFAGKRWCPAGKAVSHELDYAVIEEITPLNHAQMQSDAAEQVLLGLAKLYPCNQPGAKQ